MSENFESGHFEGRMPYRIFIPKAQSGEKLPVLLSLHGKGEWGSNNKSQLKHIPVKFAPDGVFEQNPCIIVAPQCPKEKWWSGETLDDALSLLDEMVAKHDADPRRIYITGISMGGFGTWAALEKRPDYFAAAVPICGGGNPESVSAFANVPIHVFHGGADSIVPPERSRVMVEALKAAGGDPKYTEYPEVGHNSWVQAYSDPKLYEWMFGRIRG